MDLSATLRARCPEIAIKRGATVEISFAVNTLRVDEPVQSVVWQGRPVFCQFVVTIPKGTSGQSFFAVVRVSVDGSLIGRIKFRISSDPAAAQPERVRLDGHLRRYEKPFVSYAKSDRKELLKRVQMLQITKTKFFMDLLSLDPGDRWEKRLYEQIDRCDLFLLFWSQAAKDSQWVLREAESMTLLALLVTTIKFRSSSQEEAKRLLAKLCRRSVRGAYKSARSSSSSGGC